MLINRDTDNPFPPSAVRTLFGKRGATLIGPLDLCIVEQGEVYNPNIPAGVFVGATVSAQGIGPLGTIDSYSWPPGIPGAEVDPLVVISPDPAVDISGVPDISQFAPVAHVGDQVTIDGTTVTGRINTPLQSFPYPGAAYRIHAFLIQFNSTIQPEVHGARVRLANGALLGMLLKTDNFPSGSDRALVYPA